MSQLERPPGASPSAGNGPTDGGCGRLESALRTLPRASASPGFTRRLMGRISESGAPRPSLASTSTWLWLGAVATAVLVLALTPGLVDRWRASGPGAPVAVRANAVADSNLDTDEVARLRQRRDELQAELRALRRLAAELPPVVGVEGPSADYLIDLGDLGPNVFSPSAGAVPAVYRPRP